MALWLRKYKATLDNTSLIMTIMVIMVTIMVILITIRVITIRGVSNDDLMGHWLLWDWLLWRLNSSWWLRPLVEMLCLLDHRGWNDCGQSITWRYLERERSEKDTADHKSLFASGFTRTLDSNCTHHPLQRITHGFNVFEAFCTNSSGKLITIDILWPCTQLFGCC